MSLVKVTRKGQITIPKDIRNALGINEGDYVVVRVEGNRIIIEKPRLPEPGEPVGLDKYRELIKELEEMRSRWR
ncbi:AbrB/MazE/SpoVT family DNA-binding domain-containing protein [Desulfurococcaceae archaeon MEX13E-LK6-19]|nr:AbrB/MazE/SpoVT family DNA-binding domain-containing protein [Desulfurococcaceae archaeon MEX13E-LK6-19]